MKKTKTKKKTESKVIEIHVYVHVSQPNLGGGGGQRIPPSFYNPGEERNEIVTNMKPHIDKHVMKTSLRATIEKILEEHLDNPASQNRLLVFAILNVIGEEVGKKKKELAELGETRTQFGQMKRDNYFYNLCASDILEMLK